MDILMDQPRFVANIQAVYGKAGDAWLKNLASQIDSLCTLWHCRFIEAVPNLTFNFVGIVEQTRDQQPAVLKLSPPAGPALSEICWLKQFKICVPQVLSVAESANAFLMEKCSPGNSLKAIQDGSNDDAVTEILCGVIRRLRAEAPHAEVASGSFKHLSELIPDLQALSGLADPYLFEKSVSLFNDLTQDRTTDILLHGDLHHDNILSHGESWKIIDPHGYIGDPVSEVGVMIYNPIDAFPKDKPMVELIDRRLRIMGENLQFDPKRVQAWAFCKTMLSAAWNCADFWEKARDQLEIARVIDQL